jgi:hypothetical protein
MGMGTVSRIVRPGEVTLEGRPERVLIAGNRYPSVGELVPWIVLGVGLLVAPCYAAPISPRIPPGRAQWIGTSAPILQGDFSAIGNVAEDSAGNVWVSVAENIGHTLRAHFYCGRAELLLEQAGWHSAAHLDYQYATLWPWAGYPWIAIRDDLLLAWWEEPVRPDLWPWYDSRLTVWGVCGTIDPTARSLTLGSPIELTPDPDDRMGAIFGGIHIGSDGHVWIQAVATHPGLPGWWLTAGRSNSPATWAAGVTWQIVADPFDPTGVEGMLTTESNGKTLIIFDRVAGEQSFIQVYWRSSGGIWLGPATLKAGTAGYELIASAARVGPKAYLAYLGPPNSLPSNYGWRVGRLVASDLGVTLEGDQQYGEDRPGRRGPTLSVMPTGLLAASEGGAAIASVLDLSDEYEPGELNNEHSLGWTTSGSEASHGPRICNLSFLPGSPISATVWEPDQ